MICCFHGLHLPGDKCLWAVSVRPSPSPCQQHVGKWLSLTWSMCSRQMDFPTVRIISFQLWGPSWRNTEICWVILWYKKLSQSHDSRNRTENFVLTKHKYSTWAGVLTQEDAKFERSPLAEDDFPPGDLLVNYIFEPCTCISPKCFILLIEWIRSQWVDFYSAERLRTITRCYQGLKMICFYLKCSSEGFFFLKVQTKLI